MLISHPRCRATRPEELITMKGGARARSGRAPDPNALRRERDAGEWTELPMAGREGPAPKWPLTRPSARETGLWTELWLKPQAIMWERLGQQHEVALYVRRFAEAEQRNSPVNLSTLVRQMADSLGLTTPGLRAARWKIVRDKTATAANPAANPAADSPDVPARASARDRLKVVGGNAGAGGA
jgi:hypothetical protein